MTSTYKRHFVFDMDDTLIDGRQFCGESMARVITKFRPDIKSQLVVDFHEVIRGATVTDLYLKAIAEFDLKEKVEDLVKLDQEIQTGECTQIKLFDGVVEILEFLKSNGKTLHVCTNRTMKTLKPILEHHNLTKYFDQIISCVDLGFKKPDPTCMNNIINNYGLNKDEFIYFGDSEVDRDFAKNAQIEFVIFDQYLNDKNLFKKLINMFLEKGINGFTA